MFSISNDGAGKSYVMGSYQHGSTVLHILLFNAIAVSNTKNSKIFEKHSSKDTTTDSDVTMQILGASAFGIQTQTE